MRFRNRREAGRQLADALTDRRPVDLVLALPRGGVPVAAQVARALGVPLDVLVVRKLGCPWQPELGVGAIGEGGVRVLNRDLVRRLGIGERDLRRVTDKERDELERRVRRYRDGRPAPDLRGRAVAIVDDGIATGFTARAAVEVVRELGASHVTLATPVAPPDTIRELEQVADVVVCLATPQWFAAIGEFYDDFSQTTDDEVIELLADSLAPSPPDGAGAATEPTGDVQLDLGTVRLDGVLEVPDHAIGVVAFAHGSGSSRHSPRNSAVAHHLREAGLATLLFDLLTDEESRDRRNVFDISLLGERLVAATRWLRRRGDVGRLPLGFFGASTGAAAALVAAADLGPDDVAALVSRGGRPDLAGDHLGAVAVPTLLIVGGDDATVLDLNRHAERRLGGAHRLEVVPGATHLFEEPGALEQVADLARDWFVRYLGAARPDAVSRRAG